MLWMMKETYIHGNTSQSWTSVYIIDINDARRAYESQKKMHLRTYMGMHMHKDGDVYQDRPIGAQEGTSTQIREEAQAQT